MLEGKLLCNINTTTSSKDSCSFNSAKRPPPDYELKEFELEIPAHYDLLERNNSKS